MPRIFQPDATLSNPKDGIGASKPPLDLIPPSAADVRACSQCGEEKPLLEFNRNARSQNSRRSECRACQQRYNGSFRSRKPLYNIWNLILQRCHNRRHPAYRHYGARGIRVCERWHSYEAFAVDMSPRPTPQHSVERIDNDGPYSPDNCRWATQREQTLNQRRNRLVEVNGVIRPLAEWARLHRIPQCTLEARIYRYGWDDDVAVTTPVRQYHRKCEA